MDTTKKTTAALKELTRINNDRVEGYERAIKETKEMDDDLRSTFRQFQEDSRRYAAELSTFTNNIGSEAAEGTTNPGKIYHVWMDVKTSVSGYTRESILSACEFGEDAAQKAYKDILDENGLEADAHAVIARQQIELKRAHDLIRDWRDAEKGSGRKLRESKRETKSL